MIRLSLKLLIVILVLISFRSYGQSVSKNPFFMELLKDSIAVPFVSWNDTKYVDIGATPFRDFPQLLIRNSQGLFMFLNGSGRLYKAVNQGTQVAFERIDTTIHFGYNVGSFAFSCDDTIYSLGGYGFWRANGQLRAFIKETKQWDIIKLNEEVPILCDGIRDLIWYDQVGKRIYLGRTFERNEAVRSVGLNESNERYGVYCLDIKARDWKYLGDLSSNIIGQVRSIKALGSSPWGELVFFGDKVMLIDYANNRLLPLNSTKQEIQFREISEKPNSTIDIFFIRDSTLFSWNPGMKSLGSIQLSKKDFALSNDPAYTLPISVSTTSRTMLRNWSLIIAGTTFILLIIFIALKKRPGKTHSKEKADMRSPVDNNEVLKPEKVFQMDLFDEKEVAVLHLIIANSSKGEMTTIEGINKVLGVHQKNADIQKRQRSDTIMRINEKYTFAAGDKDDIIQKQRTDHDHRTFEYFIDYNKIKSLNSLFNNSIEKRQ